MRRLGAAGLTAAYRAGELTPPEVVAELTSVGGADGTALRALAATYFERAALEAIDAAAAYDCRRKDPGAPAPRPLEGIPIVVKDLFDSAGVETAYGSPNVRRQIPDRDAAALAAALDAGAILLAKTSTDEFAYGITSHNPHLGAVRNPWAPERVSGGSAAVLAAGVAPLALGSDTGGSIRVPAAFCGVVGFKASFGLVPNIGLFPMARSLDHSGPMARTPADARLLFEVIAAPPSAAPAWEPGGAPTLVVCPDLSIAPPSPEVAAAFAAAESAAAEIVERRFPGADELFPTFLPIQQVETSHTHRSRGLYPDRGEGYGADVRERLDVAAGVGLDEFLAAEARRERLDRDFADLLAGPALLLAPVQSPPPPLIGAEGVEEMARDNVMDQTVPQNLLGLPACTVRAGFDAERGAGRRAGRRAARGRSRGAGDGGAHLRGDARGPGGLAGPGRGGLAVLAAAIFEAEMTASGAARLAAAIVDAKPRRPAGVIDVRLYLEDGVGRLVSLWESRAALDAYLAEADVPRGTELMREVGLEPRSVRVADVLAAD